MLSGLDAARERGEVLLREDADGGLRDDGASVHGGHDVVYGAAGDADACVEGLLCGVEAGEAWQEARVQVEDVIWEGVQQRCCGDAHPASHHDPACAAAL